MTVMKVMWVFRQLGPCSSWELPAQEHWREPRSHEKVDGHLTEGVSEVNTLSLVLIWIIDVIYLTL